MIRTDFLIVGQGLAGTMLAFEMLEQNLDFRIVTSPQKSKASLVAAGMVNPLVFKRLTKSWMVDELLPVMEARYQHLENLLADKFFFQKDILKPLSEQEMQLWKEKQPLPGFKKYIGQVEDEFELNGITKAPAYGIVKGAAYIQMSKFLDLAETWFHEQNLLIDADVSVESFSKSADYYELAGIRAANIVFCEGYHLTRNPLFDFVRMNPAKGEVLLIYAPDLSEKYILNKKVFVLPVGNHCFKVGSTYEWDDLSEQPTEKGRESILERLENLITVDYVVEEHWAGVRPTIADRRPVLGRLPDNPDIFVFNGLGTKGVMLAPYFARVMGDFLAGTISTLPDEVNLLRFL